MAMNSITVDLSQSPGRGEIERPPTYSIAKEQGALSRHSTITGLELELVGDKIKIKGTDNIIYSLGLSPETGTGDSLSFSLKTFRYQDGDPSRPLNRSKKIYTATEANLWFKMGRVPVSYQFEADSRSFYCFKPGFSMLDEEASLFRRLRFSDFIPWPGSKDKGEWRIIIYPEPRNHQSLHSIHIVRNRNDHSAPADFEYRMEGSKKVLAVDWEAPTPYHTPVLQWKGEIDDRRFLHAVTLAWVTAIWHKARQENLKTKAMELGQTLTCKSRVNKSVYFLTDEQRETTIRKESAEETGR
jgi:hypothetical protein